MRVLELPPRENWSKYVNCAGRSAVRITTSKANLSFIYLAVAVRDMATLLALSQSSDDIPQAA